MGLGRGGAGVTLSHHHPAHVIDDRLAALIGPFRAHIDNATLPVRVLLEPDHLRNGRERIAGKNRLQKPAIGIAEIGDRVQRDVRHRLAEHDMEGEQIVDWACRVADRASKSFRALRRETRPGESGIERGVAAVQRAGRCVTDGLAEAKVLEEPPCRGLGRNGGSHPDGSEDVRIDVINDDPLDQHDGKQKDDRRNVDASR